MSRRPTIGGRGRRFTLQVPQDTPDGFGGQLRAWVSGAQLWGAMEMLSGAERVRADRPESVVTHRVTLPFREGLADGARLALGSRRFRIRAASDPDGRRRLTVCLVEEIAA